MTRLLQLILILSISLVIYGCGNKTEKIETGPNFKAKSAENKCIDRVIAEDSKLGKIRNEASKTVSLSKSIDTYVDGMEQLDFTTCPGAFTAAFEDHIIAWKNMTVVTDKHPDLRGEMHDLFDGLKTGEDSIKFKQLLDEIWRTWGMVEAAMAQF